MPSTCLGCTCSQARTTAGTGRLLLATRVDHTVASLRALARRKGVALDLLAPGLMSLQPADVRGFIAAARRELSGVESDEVRCLVSEHSDPSDAALLALAMSAPSLSEAGARVQHAALLPLFEDEEARFSSVYQPIVSLPGRGIVGYEALLRATDQTGVEILPEVLFPAAEEAGWTHLVDRVGRTTALRHAGQWLGDALLFINFIPTSIYRPEVCLRTTELAAQEAGVRLDQIVFEVTESHQVRDIDHLERVFAYYRSRNCRVALDDLGAGYSSLNMLVRLKPDIVKLDKELVQRLPDPASSAVVAAIVSIAHSYGGLVLAECVETEEQAEAAVQLGVDLGQGWLFGRPERALVTPTSVAARRPVDPSQPDRAVAVADAQDDLPAARGGLPMGTLLERAVDASASGVVVVDMLATDAVVIYANEAFQKLSGYTADETLGQNCRMLQGPDTDPGAVQAIARAIRHGEGHRTVLRNYRKDGSQFWNELHLSPVRDDDSRLTHYLGFQYDVTARVEAEARLAVQAALDSLTGLANRASLVELLDQALVDAAERDQAVAVLYLDLDGFKNVNDALGHAAGDTVLVEVAARLRASLRPGDPVARSGGDEFVVVLAGLDPVDAPRVALRAADDLVAALQRPFDVGARRVQLGGSVGVALYPDDATTSEQLLQRADVSMYQAKNRAGQVRTDRRA